MTRLGDLLKNAGVDRDTVSNRPNRHSRRKARALSQIARRTPSTLEEPLPEGAAEQAEARTSKGLRTVRRKR